MNPLPDTIQARLHPGALERVTRMFSATVSDVLGELLQNARRSGAEHVHVQITERPETYVVHVTDDGRGISDPALLLSFGENGWDEQTVAREDAAGMGFAALSQFSSTVVSQAAGGPAWQASLTPLTFTGKAEAPVRPAMAMPSGHGTRVSFSTRVKPDVITQHAIHATTFYPLKATLGLTAQGKEPQVIALKQRSFLADAPCRADLGGIIAGARIVSPDMQNRCNLNFHGHVASVKLPCLQSLDSRYWAAFLDVQDCPDLQLTLPARKEAIENDFLTDLRDRLLTFLYRAIAQSDVPCMTHDHYLEARRRGVELSVPKARLYKWVPETASGATSYQPPSPKEGVPPGAFLVDRHDTSADDLTVHHALEKAGLLAAAFSPQGRMKGYDWYQALPYLYQYEILIDGVSLHDLDFQARLRIKRPQKIEGVLTFRTNDGSSWSVRTEMDHALVGEPDEWLEGDSAWFLSSKATFDTDGLAGLLEYAFFDAWEDFEADNVDTQRALFRREAQEVACKLLIGDDEALRRTVHGVLKNHLPQLFYGDLHTVIDVRKDRCTVRQQPRTADPEPSSA